MTIFAPHELALNERTSVNFGYADSWTFGTRITSESINPGNTSGLTTSRARDLQIGRFLFGLTYRVSDQASVNWNLELEATNDAPDVRTTVRIPITLVDGH